MGRDRRCSSPSCPWRGGEAAHKTECRHILAECRHTLATSQDITLAVYVQLGAFRRCNSNEGKVCTNEPSSKVGLEIITYNYLVLSRTKRRGIFFLTVVDGCYQFYFFNFLFSPSSDFIV